MSLCGIKASDNLGFHHTSATAVDAWIYLVSSTKLEHLSGTQVLLSSLFKIESVKRYLGKHKTLAACRSFHICFRGAFLSVNTARRDSFSVLNVHYADTFNLCKFKSLIAADRYFMRATRSGKYFIIFSVKTHKPSALKLKS